MTIHHKIGLRYPGIAGVVLALLVALSGCHKEVGESGPTGESDGGARHVRIAASIDTYSLPGSRPSTRAAGTWEEVPGSGIWTPHAELGLDYERAVYFAVLYIYPEGAAKPSSAWIYYTNAFAAGCKSLKGDKSSPLSKIKDLEELSQSNSQVRHFASTELTKGTLTMDLELEPGKYKFVLVANSIPALTSAIKSTTSPADPHDLKSEETAFTSLDLMPNTVTKLPRRFMPMVGSQDFTITSSTAVPQVINSPTIDLERTFARLDVCLTTAKDADLTAYHEKHGYVPTDFRFLEYSLKGMGGYEQPIFPLKGETTAIKEKSTAKVAAPTPSEVVDPKITVESKEGPILLSNIAKSFDEKEANTFNTPTKLSTPWAEPIQVSKLWKSPIFRTTTDEAEPAGKYYGSFTKDPESASADAKHPAIHLYIPSLYQEGKDHEVSFTLKFGRAENASQTKEYTISLTNQSDATDLYAIRRNTWYRYELKFYGEEMRVLGPLTLTPKDWSLEEESLSYDDEYIVLTQDTVTLSANEGAKGKFMILSDQLGSTSKSLTYTFDGESTPPEWLKMEGELPTSLKGESTEVAFSTLSENEDDNDMPRVCELVITPKDYKRPLRVVIRQLPIQYIQARPYVAFVGDRDSGPLDAEIAVETHNYDWEAELVDTYCTAASTGGWLTLEKIDNQTLKISVKPVEARMNILRIGMIKIYDGTNHPAYIRVEQGGYKAIELENNGQVQVWLDRNMGALSYAHYKQWNNGAVITGFDRVRVNGAFYQTGRVPDGYQYNGMDLLAGNINTSLTAAEKIDLLASRQPRRLGDAAGSGGSSIVSPEEQLPAADPQYHKFIVGGAQDNWFSLPFRDPKWFKLNPGKKREGLDPCPEGYRIPFKNEFETMIRGEQISSDGTMAGGSQFRENAMGYFYKTKDSDRSLYIPLGGWRDTDGSLRDWWKVNDGVTPKAKYAIYNHKSPSQVGYYLLGYDNSMQFFAYPETTKTAEGLLVRCIKITDK